LTCKHLLANGLHNSAVQDALDHIQLQRVRRIIEQVDGGLGTSCKESASCLVPKIFWDDDRGSRLTFANDFPRHIRRGRIYAQAPVTGQLSHEFSRNVALVLVDYQHRHLAGLGVAFLPTEQVAKEGAADDWHNQARHQRSAVCEKQLQIFADQGQKLNHHMSRRLRPVRVKKTVSKSAWSVET